MSDSATTDVVRGSGFIDRTIVGPGVLNVLKGLAWGNCVAISQSVGTAFAETTAAAKAEGKAVDISAFKRLTFSKAQIFIPSVVAHTIAFTLIRGNGDTRGISGALKPLAVVALPTVAYAAYHRAVPPQALRFGLYSAILLHVYDRILKPHHGVSYENLPTTHLHRRVF